MMEILWDLGPLDALHGIENKTDPFVAYVAMRNLWRFRSLNDE